MKEATGDEMPGKEKDQGGHRRIASSRPERKGANRGEAFRPQNVSFNPSWMLRALVRVPLITPWLGEPS